MIKKATRAKAKPVVAAAPVAPKGVSYSALASIGRGTPAPAYVIPRPFPGVVPKDRSDVLMANDSAVSSAYEFAASQGMGQGFFWPGYTYLAELAQRPEYRRISETIAKEMTRKWIRFHTSGDGDKSEKIKALNHEMRRLKVQDAFRQVVEQDGFFGRSQLFMDLNVANKSDLTTPLFLDQRVIAPGSLKRLRVIEPMWTYPGTYNSTDPTRPDFYRPTTWWIMGQEIHSSRLPLFVGREMPDLLKPAYMFGGLSLSQMLKPYIDNWLRTRQSVSDLIHSFSVSGIKTNMLSVLQGGMADSIVNRAEMFNRTRDNRGLFLLDKDTEEFFNVTTPLSTLDKLQAQAQEHIASIAGIPLTILLGITPSGLNASSEGEIRTFYAWIEAQQNDIFRDPLTRVLKIMQLSLFGKIDEDIDFSFVPLWTLDEDAKATVRKTNADTAAVYIGQGVLSPDEERERLASEDEGIYSNLDLSQPLPEPPVDPAAGPPGAGGPDDGSPGLETDADEATPSEETDNTPPPKPAPTVSSGADDAEWDEGAHKRAPDGKFGSGGASSLKKTEGWTKTGGQLGSNPGGKYKDETGQAHYVKQSKSDDHAKSEVLAGHLYDAAGAPTVGPQLVDVGKGKLGVATKWQNNEGNINQHSEQDRKDASQHFATHAWLSNWDAVGMEHDNQARINGQMTTMDVGGSLEYRAQGNKKGAAFGNKVTELETMRDADKNSQAHSIFGDMTTEEQKESALQVAAISDETIRDIVNEHGPGNDAAKKALADKLIARRDHIKEVYQIKDADFEAGHERGPDGKFLKGAEETPAAEEPKAEEVKPASKHPSPHPLSKTQVEMFNLANSDMDHDKKVDNISIHLGLSAPGGATSKYGAKLLKSLGAEPLIEPGASKKMPAPHPLSKVQVAMSEVANGDGTLADKIGYIETNLMMAAEGGATAKYGKKLLDALGPAPAEEELAIEPEEEEYDDSDIYGIKANAAPEPEVEATATSEIPAPTNKGSHTQNVIYGAASSGSVSSEDKIAYIQQIKKNLPGNDKYANSVIKALGGDPDAVPTDKPFWQQIEETNEAAAPAAAAPKGWGSVEADTPEPVEIPLPNEGSAKQKALYADLHVEGVSNEDKIKLVKHAMSSTMTGGFQQEYAKSVLKALGDKPEDSGYAAPDKVQQAIYHQLKDAPHSYMETASVMEGSDGKKIKARLIADTSKILGNNYAAVTAAYGDKPDDAMSHKVSQAMEVYATQTKDVRTDAQNSAIDAYQGAGYQSINNHLLGKATGSAATKAKVKRIQEAINASAIPANTPVYRGMRCSLEDLSGFSDPAKSVGRAFEHKNFCSASRNIDTAKGFGEKVMLKFTIPAGTPGLTMGGQNGGEREVVLNSRSMFRIDRVEDHDMKYGHKGHVVHCTYLGVRED